jgi:hypothetical protein
VREPKREKEKEDVYQLRKRDANLGAVLTVAAKWRNEFDGGGLGLAVAL